MKRNDVFKKLLPFLLIVTLTLSLFACNKADTERAFDSATISSGDEREVTPAKREITDDDFLTANGKYLVNKNGEKVVLQGVNLGGWLHMEGWMDGGGYSETLNDFVNHYAVVSALKKRFSDEQTESLLETYQKNYIQRSDLEFIASLGLNYVRIPFFWTEILDFDGNVKENAFDQLDWAIEECSRLGIYVVLDLHGSVGGHSNGCLTGGHSGSNELWTSEDCRLKTEKIWRAVAERYKDEPAVAGYDLLNEPMPPENSPISTNDMYDRFYKVVREVDEKHVIIVEAFYYYTDLSSPADNGWENVLYEVHFYEDSDKTPDRQRDFVNWIIADMLSHREEYKVPMLFGEYNFWTGEDAWRTCMHSLTANGISWSSWAYKNVDKTKDNNWGYFYNADVEIVDYENDSFETIAKKWAGYSTDNYEKNEFLTEIIKECAGEGFSEPENEIEFGGVFAQAYRTNGGEPLINVFDGDPLSRWSNGEPQKNNGEQFISINFGETVSLGGILLYTPNPDVAKNIAIYYKKQNGAWKLLKKAECVIGNTVIRFTPVEADAVKIVNESESENRFWSIYELRFLSE